MKQIIVLAFMMLGNCLIAQNNKDTPVKRIQLTGSFSDEALKEIEKFRIKSGTTPHLIISEDYNEYIPANQKNLPIQIINGKFSVTVNFNTNLGYIRFFIPGMRINSTSHDAFLFKSGDNVHIQIESDHEVTFSGKGADKLNYQFWASMLMKPYMRFADGHGFYDVKRIDYNKSYTSKFLKVTIDSLNKLSHKWSQSVTDILRLNTVATFNLRYLNGITNINIDYGESYLALIQNELNYVLYQQLASLERDPYVINNSFQFVNYLYLLNEKYEQTRLNKKNLPFEVLFNRFKNDYHGQLMDKLLTRHFLKQKSPMESVGYLKEAIQLVRDKVSLKVLNSLINMKVKGVGAFNFQFMDMNGDPVTLADNKEKIIIIDSYYLGCTACAILAKKMTPVIAHFSKRKDVVFISLNALDKDFGRVKDGVNSGRYGDEKTTYVHTNGVGNRHPYILFYNILSYPDQIVIDKKGKILDINPSDGFKETEAFQKYMIETIERNL